MIAIERICKEGWLIVFLGLDVGSSSCKCAAFAEDGKMLASSEKEYAKTPGQIGLDARVLFEYVCAAVRSCTEQVEAAGDIVSVTVSSFGESFVPIDKAGRVLAPVAMYTDGDGAAETEFLRRNAAHIGRIAGAAPNCLYALPRMMQMLNTVPGLRDNLWKFLQIEDYVVFRFCGETVIDYSLACRALAFDVGGHCWSEEILETAGFGSHALSKPVPAGTVAGEMHDSLALALGLRKGVKIVSGMHDQVAAATGAGALRTGDAVVGTGSVECITPVFDSFIADDAFLNQNYVCVPHAVPGLYVTYAFTLSGGSLLSWYRDRLVPYLKPSAEAGNCSVYDLLNENCPSEPSDIIVVPHFGGTGTPELASPAFGTIAGLSMGSGLPEIYRAVMEGLCFEMRFNREKLKESGIEFSSLRATGGGARSPLWLQMKADVLDIPVETLETSDAGAVGGAMAAAVSLGAFRCLEEAASCFVKTGKLILPNRERTKLYDKKYSRYIKIRQAMLSLNNEI
ncbi:MAG: FGGY-family carbohydrate kinase [Clostridiales bacterium]|nr:FGGY-family carbohydrate kinase [Clostridiales bacterium]